jgi:aminoglycoside phosphotransferase
MAGPGSERVRAPDARWQRAFDAVERLVGGRLVGAEALPRWRPAWNLEVERDGERVPVHFRGERPEARPGGLYSLERELGVLRVLEAHGIPVPHVYGGCEDPPGIVMERCPGRANLATARDEAERRAVLGHYVDLLVRMHAIPVAAFEPLGMRSPQGAEALGLGDLPVWERGYRRGKRRPEPLIEFALGWLRRNVPRQRRVARFIAGDAGQFVFEDGRVTGVLDLELACLGDPLSDLAALRCRDVSEPLGDLSRAYHRYAERSGEPVDPAVVDYHTARFALCTPLAVANLCAAPFPGFNLAQYLGWYLVFGRIAVEVIASRLGVALEPPALPEPAPSRHAAALDALVGQLGAEPQERRPYATDVALRLAQYAREADARGAPLEREGLEELAALLGRRPGSWAEADAALEAFVLAAGPERDAEIARALYRRGLRHEALLAPAMRELAGASLQRVWA